MQYLSRTGWMSVGEELTGTGEVWSAGACDWTFDHATAIQPQVTGSSVTVTSSPALNDVRDHPRCVIAVGFCVSTAQFRTVPESSFASNCRKQCGLLQIHSVTVPFTVTSLPVSRAAAP